MSYNSLLHDLKTLLIQRKVNATLSNMTSEEKENLNQIINFAVTWWLQGVDTSNISLNTKDSNIDFVDFMVKSRPLSKEQIERLEEFKICMGMTLLKTLLISNKDIELHCGYSPEGILNSILIQSNCCFLDMHLPKKTHMTINRTQIWISEGYAASEKCLAFDVNNPHGFEKMRLPESTLILNDLPENITFENLTREQLTAALIGFNHICTRTGELILPPNFTPSKYDFVGMYIASQCTNIEIETYKRERKNRRIY